MMEFRQVTRTSDARERLIRTAARLFLTRSYQGVGVDQLCAAADIRKGSFYHFFASKVELAKAVIDYHAAALWAGMDAAAAATGDTPPDRLLHEVAEVIGAIQTGLEDRFGHVVGCPFGNLAAELATADEDLRLHVAQVFAEWERRLAVLCHLAAAQGALRPGTDPGRLAHMLIAQFQGMVLMAKTTHSPAAEIAAALHQVIDAHLA
jgi:TetR/AcrR family transcriptional repressor of nem operon